SFKRHFQMLMNLASDSLGNRDDHVGATRHDRQSTASPPNTPSLMCLRVQEQGKVMDREYRRTNGTKRYFEICSMEYVQVAVSQIARQTKRPPPARNRIHFLTNQASIARLRC